MGCEASGLALAVGVAREVSLLAIERLQPSLGLPPAALVLFQWYHAGKVSLCEPLDLLVQPRPRTAQVGPPRLRLLRQPMPAAGPLHRMRDYLRRGEHLAQVAPNQILQRPAQDVARWAASTWRRRSGLRHSPADVVVVAPGHVSACAGAAAASAADQATQEVLMHPVVPRRHALIIGQPFLRALELFVADDSRHGRHRNPLGRVRHPPAIPTPAGRP